MSAYIHFTEEQKERANSVDLEEFLQRNGETLIPSGREKRLKSDHSITIRGNEWFDHAAEEGGHAIDFIQKFYGLSFPDAVTVLLGGEQGEIYSNQNDSISKFEAISKENNTNIETLNKEVAIHGEKLGDLKRLIQDYIQTLSEKVAGNNYEFDARLDSTTNEVTKNKINSENAIKEIKVGIEQQVESMSAYLESELSRAKNEITELKSAARKIIKSFEDYYDKDESGNLIINEKQARIVRRIYLDYLNGKSPNRIVRELEKEGVLNWNDLAKWYESSIRKMLSNGTLCSRRPILWTSCQRKEL